MTRCAHRGAPSGPQHHLFPARQLVSSRPWQCALPLLDSSSYDCCNNHYPPPQRDGFGESEKKHKQANQTGWIMAKDKAAQQVSAEKVQSYTDAFALITEATGISDVDVLVATFVNAEDENYRLFKYVEELNQEIAKLEEQVCLAHDACVSRVFILCAT